MQGFCHGSSDIDRAERERLKLISPNWDDLVFASAARQKYGLSKGLGRSQVVNTQLRLVKLSRAESGKKGFFISSVATLGSTVLNLIAP